MNSNHNMHINLQYCILKKYTHHIEIYQNLYNSTVIHEKPLSNALGDNFKEILSYEKVKEIFKRM